MYHSPPLRDAFILGPFFYANTALSPHVAYSFAWVKMKQQRSNVCTEGFRGDCAQRPVGGFSSRILGGRRLRWRLKESFADTRQAEDNGRCTEIAYGVGIVLISKISLRCRRNLVVGGNAV